jgi:hypothetical protein
MPQGSRGSAHHRDARTEVQPIFGGKKLDMFQMTER